MIDPAENTTTKRYADSPEGVREMLSENFSCSLAIEQFESDPYVPGVWRITEANGSRAIVYLAGFSDASGCLREHNDAEFEDQYPCGEDAEWDDQDDEDEDGWDGSFRPDGWM